MSPSKNADPPDRDGLAAKMLRALFGLVGRIRLDMTPGYDLIPLLAPADLWRVGPRLIRLACDYAEIVTAGCPESPADLRQMRDIANLIERAPAPGVTL